MSKILEDELLRTEQGNDPWDNRGDPDYLNKARRVDRFSRFELTDNMTAEIESGSWLIPDLIWGNHVIVLVARANVGKTTLAMHIAAELAKKCNVVYINADISASDALAHVERAKAAGFRLLLPDMIIGQSMRQVTDELKRCVAAGDNLGGTVFFIDTLKKMGDVINKREIKDILHVFRQLTAICKATVVVLHHANKYEHDGELIYEGTNDVRDNVDELFYLKSTEIDGVTNISVWADKDRTPEKPRPLTFEVNAAREVKLKERFVDIEKREKDDQARARDNDCIALVFEALRVELTKQTEIVDYVSGEGGGSRAKVTKLLRKYNNQNHMWRSEKGPNNSWLYMKF